MQKSIEYPLVSYEGEDMNTQYIKMSEPVISNIDLFFIELYANDMQQLHLLKRSYCPKEKKQ